eukprot:4584782-Pyramimonas_sp.AAC.1
MEWSMQLYAIVDDPIHIGTLSLVRCQFERSTGARASRCSGCLHLSRAEVVGVGGQSASRS